jgi:hypothetical protein
MAPFDIRYGHVFCVVDPESPDEATLGAALRLARLLAVTSLAGKGNEIDPRRALQAVTAIRSELDAVRRLKTQLTSIRTAASEVTAGLDRLRDQVVARVADAEEQLQTRN